MQEFIDAYKKWLQARSWGAQHELTAKQRIILAQADNAKKKAWNTLPESRRKAIVEEMVLQGILPKIVINCMEIFDARIIGI